jgi:hypothetical protein
MWIDRPVPEVQGRGLWDSARTINRTGQSGIDEDPVWENPARISQEPSSRIRLTAVRDLLSFNNSERIMASLPHPLMKG